MPPKPTVQKIFELNQVEVELVLSGLDSHEYWQLSDEKYRSDGYVIEPGTDDPEKLGELVATQKLAMKLAALRAAEGENVVILISYTVVPKEEP